MVPLKGLLQFGAALQSDHTLERRESYRFIVEMSMPNAAPESKVLLSMELSSIAGSDPAWLDQRIDLADDEGEVGVVCFAVYPENPAMGVVPEDAARPTLWIANPTVKSKGRLDGSAKRGNLLLITIDTTRADHLASAGYPLTTTPCLDRLAAEGEQFLGAVSNSSWTLPSHASLFTGLYPSEHGAQNNPTGDKKLISTFNALSPEALTLAERLSGIGYRTGSVIAGPMLSVEFGFAQGFDYHNEPAAGGESRSLRTADEVTDLALAWIDAEEQPFFLFLNYFDPHWPYDPPPDLARDWVAPDVRFIRTGEYTSIWHEVMQNARDIRKEEKRSMISNYDGEIAFMDREIGRLLESLKHRGIYDTTLIVVVSDHGESFGEHRMLDHGHSLYEHVLQVPLIIKYPKTNRKRWAGRVYTHRVDLLDTYATICRELGLPLPGRLEPFGIKKARSYHYSEVRRNDWFVAAYGTRFDRDLQAVYHGKWKLIRDDEGKRWLFDLAKDPQERTNLVDHEASRVNHMARILDSWSVSLESNRLRTSRPEISPELEERLRTLGYIGSPKNK
jgi:arylsulfatase A-like enzyme